MPIRLGTRQSALATWQANWVASELKKLGHEVEMVPITTTGDVSTKPLGEVGGQGLFTKEIQRALLDHRCDLAVHSLKDLPTEPIEGLRLASVPARELVGDALIGRTASTLRDLAEGAIVGTGSVRRAAQLRSLRPDLIIRDIRGNVDTRLRKLDEGDYDAIILALAGLKRLGWDSRVTEVIPIEQMLPAVGQAALGLETRSEDREIQSAVAPLNDPATMAAVLAERELLRSLRGGCLAPVAAHASIVGDRLRLIGMVLAIDGNQRIKVELDGPTDNPVGLGQTAAKILQRDGADRLIDAARSAR